MSEILAPAGNSDSLFAAVRAGADAVYLGCGDFNARRNAKNFTFEELKNATEYCRVRGVKVYLTLNTLLYNGEIEKALNTAVLAAECGVDGFICADLGLCSLIKKALPTMPLHASTQLTVHSASALYLLKELGFCRVVPSREMSRKELTKLCTVAKEIGMEVEVFVHGALCMCMSGQCLMSAHLGGRSGNRGLCAGTCRLPFYVGEREYALSLKDMSYIEYIKELEQMGVTSFKIEGRMKTPEYVSTVVSACKDMRDGEVFSAEKARMLSDIFSRSGFTDGYFTEKRGTDMFGYRTKNDESNTKAVQNSAHEIYRTEFARVPLDIKFTCKRDMPISLMVSDGKNKTEVFSDAPLLAQNRPLSAESAVASLTKLGGTPYFAKSTECVIDDGLFVSASQLNSMRRSAIEEITKMRAVPRTVKTVEIEFSELPEKTCENTCETLLYFNDVAQIPDNICDETVIIPAEQLPKLSPEIKNRVVLSLARGIENESSLEKVIAEIDRKYTLLCENLAHVYFAEKYGFNFIVGAGLNVLNRESARVFENLGAEKIILSYEIKLSEIANFSNKCGLCIFGRTPLMLVRNCPISAVKGCKNCDGKITDRKQVEFPIKCRKGFAQIFNSRPMYLADRLREFENCGFHVLYFSTETKAQVAEVLSDYRNQTPPQEEYTRGLYYKGVL